MSISAWIAALIGLAVGGFIGIIVGLCISDAWWHKNVAKYQHLIPRAHDTEKDNIKRG